MHSLAVCESISIDYMALTHHADTRPLIPPPLGCITEKAMHWQAGPALYEGYSYEYPDGHMQSLFSPEQGTLVRISGHLCERLFPTIDLDHFRLTRLDLCITIPEQIDVDAWYRLQRLRGTKIKATLINGQTLYIGSRKSMRFWRIYDKAAEQGIPGPLYRIELELKGMRARQAKAHLHAGNREGIWLASKIGVVGDIIASLGIDERPEGATVNVELPRKPPAGRKFFENVVIPFLKSNPWAVDALVEEGILPDDK